MTVSHLWLRSDADAGTTSWAAALPTCAERP